ncbi:hypothetical protein ACUXEY_005311 [Bacillus sp. F9_6S_D1_P_5]
MNLLFFLLWIVIEMISAIFRIYQRNSIYISDFLNLSAQLSLYQRFFKYIDLPTKNDTKKEATPTDCWNTLPFSCFYTRFSLYLFYNMPFLIPLYCTVVRVMIKRKPSIVFSAVLHPFLLIFNRFHWIIIVCHYP